MEINNLANRAANLFFDFNTQGSLGPNAKRAEVGTQDEGEVLGAAIMAELFQKADNQAGLDQDPAAGQIHMSRARFTQWAQAELEKEMPGMGKSTTPTPAPEGELIGSFAKANGNVHIEVEQTGADHDYTVMTQGPNGSLAMLTLRDKGDHFEAEGLHLDTQNGDLYKETRSGSWTELPDSLCFSGPSAG